jgi:hypothetical protein
MAARPKDFTYEDLFYGGCVRVPTGWGSDMLVYLDASDQHKANVRRLARSLGLDPEGKSHADVCSAVVRWLKKHPQGYETKRSGKSRRLRKGTCNAV